MKNNARQIARTLMGRVEDAMLALDVRFALQRVLPMRIASLLHVTVSHRTVTLTGYVRHASDRQKVEDATRKVKSVSGVQNNIVCANADRIPHLTFASDQRSSGAKQ
jgi:osmotically-inducible protein OsmY